ALSFLPEPSFDGKLELRLRDGSTLRLAEERLSFQLESRALGFDLGAPFTVLLGRMQDAKQSWLGLELRQSKQGDWSKLRLRAPYDGIDTLPLWGALHQQSAAQAARKLVLGSSAKADATPQLRLEHQQMQALLAALRAAMQLGDGEHWQLPELGREAKQFAEKVKTWRASIPLAPWGLMLELEPTAVHFRRTRRLPLRFVLNVAFALLLFGGTFASLLAPLGALSWFLGDRRVWGAIAAAVLLLLWSFRPGRERLCSLGLHGLSFGMQEVGGTGQAPNRQELGFDVLRRVDVLEKPVSAVPDKDLRITDKSQRFQLVFKLGGTEARSGQAASVQVLPALLWEKHAMWLAKVLNRWLGAPEAKRLTELPASTQTTDALAPPPKKEKAPLLAFVDEEKVAGRNNWDPLTIPR
ncbi:MAG: hypothetical protein RBU37_20605, partial [Myxococcota bacterium]|nr:hypothetical protein [Myxococcota bacterium]